MRYFFLRILSGAGVRAVADGDFELGSHRVRRGFAGGLAHDAPSYSGVDGVAQELMEWMPLPPVPRLGTVAAAG